jgi:hypothetical protein
VPALSVLPTPLFDEPDVSVLLEPCAGVFAGGVVVFVLVDGGGSKLGIGSASPPTPELQPMPRAPMVNTNPLIFSHSLGINAELRMLFFKVVLVSGEQRSCRLHIVSDHPPTRGSSRAAAEQTA